MDINAFTAMFAIFIVFPVVLAHLLVHFAMTHGDTIDRTWKETINENKNDSI